MTGISDVSHLGEPGELLENDDISLVLLPRIGGKIASLFYKPQGFEVLFQPVLRRYELPSYGAPFDRFDTSGADEMYPTIDACTYPKNGPEIACPDHGELWSIPWSVERRCDELVTAVTGRALPYRFSRTLRLDGASVRFDYRVDNEGDKPLFGLWAFHGLVACDPQTKIALPRCRDGRREVLNVQDSKTAGEAGRRLPFPGHPLGPDATPIERVVAADACATRKHYVDGPVECGECSLTLNRGRLRYSLRFPETQIPYLGVWINEGGFKGEYNCALEPSSGYYDRLDLAVNNDSQLPIPPHSSTSWWMEIDLSEIR